MAKAYKTNYKDPGGKTQVGYLIDNKTYKDPEGKNRIEVGSTVETSDGYYTLTSSGGVKLNNFKDITNKTKSQIDTLKETSKRKLENLYEAKEAYIDNQKREIRDAYNREAQKEYIRSKQAEKNINQLLKAQGITGGMSESRLLQNQLAHENAVNELKYYRDDKLYDLDAQLLALRNETDYNIANENSKYDQLYLEYADKNLQREIDQLYNELQLASDNYHRNKSYDRDVYEFEENMAWDREKEAIHSQQFYDDLNWEKQAFEIDQAQKEKEFQHKVQNDNRNYNLSVKKANSSGGSSKNDNTEYNRKLNDAKVKATFGDFSGYAELYGWDAKTVDQAFKHFLRISE